MVSSGLHLVCIESSFSIHLFFQMAKNAHMRQIEQMESEELLAQKKLRTEVIQLEDMLAQVSRLEVEKLS